MKLFSVLFFFTFLGYGFSQPMESYEIKLIEKLEEVHFEKDFDKCMNLNEDFKTILTTTIENKEAFTYSFDSLSNFMSTTISEDGIFRIFNWNIQLEGQKQHYECWILLNNLKVIKLQDFKNNIPEIEYASLDENTWFGALYYTIIPNKKKNKTIYTLLGWDGNDMFSNKKIIESMYITKKKKINFGFLFLIILMVKPKKESFFNITNNLTCL